MNIERGGTRSIDIMDLKGSISRIKRAKQHFIGGEPPAGVCNYELTSHL